MIVVPPLGTATVVRACRVAIEVVELPVEAASTGAPARERVQGRFTSRLVEKETYLLVLARYIVLNPVRADLVSSPADWRWSCYRAHAGSAEPPPFLTVDWLLTRFDTIDRRSAQKAYRRFVHEGVNDSKTTLDDRPIVGSDAFVANFRDSLRSAAPQKDIPRVQRFAARPTLREVFAGCRDRRDRNARILKAHVGHGYTMTKIADHLKLHLMTISRAVHKC